MRDSQMLRSGATAAATTHAGPTTVTGERPWKRYGGSSPGRDSDDPPEADGADLFTPQRARARASVAVPSASVPLPQEPLADRERIYDCLAARGAPCLDRCVPGCRRR